MMHLFPSDEGIGYLDSKNTGNFKFNLSPFFPEVIAAIMRV